MILDKKNIFPEGVHFFKRKLAICRIPVGETGERENIWGFRDFEWNVRGHFFKQKIAIWVIRSETRPLSCVHGPLVLGFTNECSRIKNSAKSNRKAWQILKSCRYAQFRHGKKRGSHSSLSRKILHSQITQVYRGKSQH